MYIKQKSKNVLAKNLRFHALQILDGIENHDKYSNISINQFLKNSNLTDRDERLLVQIVYGVLQRRLTLDYYLTPLISGRKVDDWIQTLLRMSIYQLLFLDRIPQHAVVNEAVTIAKINGHIGLSKFVNGVLREFLRSERPKIDEISDITERLSLKYSMGQEIVDNLKEQLSLENLEQLLASLLENPFVSVRINPKICQRQEAIQLLLSEGYQVEESQVSPFGIRVLQGNIIKSKAYKLGLITVQDESSMLVIPLGKIAPEDKVLDACSAPGGKATHIASYLTQGKLTALDISSHKMELVAQHVERMKLKDSVEMFVTDARKFVPSSGENYDRIYLDAPCTGTGLMRRKPEIKYQDFSHQLNNLVETQAELLNHLVEFLKPGGSLIYSTCSITREENEDVLSQFLAKHPEMAVQPILEEEVQISEFITPEGYLRIWPHEYHTDGFFIARLKKL